MTDYDPDELVTIDQIAERKGCSANTLYSRRHRNTFPPGTRRYGRLVWRWGDVEGVPIVRRALGRPQAKDGG